MKFLFNKKSNKDRNITDDNIFTKFASPGHYYSPIPDLNEVQKYKERIYDTIPKEIGEIDLQIKNQLLLLNKFESYYQDLPFTDQKSNKLRYFYDNPAFSYGDAILLYSMLRLIKPRRYVEVGSGYSSCVALDTDELFLNKQTDFTFIEPYPDLLYSLIDEIDIKRVNIISKNLQDIDLEFFSKLTTKDFLFFDSTHVCKVGSDVQYIFSEILPVIGSEIVIHFHDIFYPFEYPEEWLLEGRAWNEAYILRAFLQNNTKYKILYFNNYMGKFYKDLITSKLPLVNKNIGGSIWILKT